MKIVDCICGKDHNMFYEFYSSYLLQNYKNDNNKRYKIILKSVLVPFRAQNKIDTKKSKQPSPPKNEDEDEIIK